LGSLDGIPVCQARGIPPGLDGLFRDRGVLPPASGNRSLAAAAGADVLSETMAQMPHQSPRVDQTRVQPAAGYLHRPEPQGAISTRQDAGHPVGDDQPMAEGSGFVVCQRTVGEDSLPRYGAV